MTTLLLNFSVDSTQTRDLDAQIQLVTNICLLFMEVITDPEAKFRLLVALGTILHSDREHVRLANELQCGMFLDKLTNGESLEKVVNCSKCIKQLF